MGYYYIFLTTMLSMNVNCFITNGYTRANNPNNFMQLHSTQTKAGVGDYLSYIATAPPFVSVPKVSSCEASATPPKTSTDYLSYISTAPPFKSTSAEAFSSPIPVKTSSDYLSHISSTPTSIPVSTPTPTKMSTDYLSYISSAAPFPSAQVAVPKHQHHHHHIAISISVPSCTGSERLLVVYSMC